LSLTIKFGRSCGAQASVNMFSETREAALQRNGAILFHFFGS
jgi:hypothetical protein